MKDIKLSPLLIRKKKKLQKMKTMIKPQDKVMGFMYQLLGFSICYLWYTLIRNLYDTWYCIPICFLLLLGVFLLIYGSSKFIIDYESRKTKTS